MGSIRSRKSNGLLFFDFRVDGERYREQTALPDTPTNRKKLKRVLEKIETEISLGTFQYSDYFPNSSNAKKFAKETSEPSKSDMVSFKEFAQTWIHEMQIQWKETYFEENEILLKKHLLPAFGDMSVNQITKADILQFRAELGKLRGRTGSRLSASRINHIMTPIRVILREAADRYQFVNPYQNIKQLKVPKTDVQPFSLEEVTLILENVREDYRNYFIVRFFTGMRTSEINGLRWKNIDFQKRQILIKEAYVKGKMSSTKTEESERIIEMAAPVRQALLVQQKQTGNKEFAFCTKNGNPIDAQNFTKNVWYPLLRFLNLEKRRPYQTRHTAATLWLGAGENPEWIARQMGHSTTEMLFRVYSRYVPNLTRQDGSAFDHMLSTHGFANHD